MRGITVAAIIFSFLPSSNAANNVLLGTAGKYVMLATSTITSDANSLIIGDVGLSPGTALAGFALTEDSTNTYYTSSEVVGKLYTPDNVTPTPGNLITAKDDMDKAIAFAGAQASSEAPDIEGGQLTSQVFTPGVYKWSSAVSITQSIALQGACGDVFIFQITGALVQAADTAVLLSGGVDASTIFWYVEGGATINGATFQGNILSKTMAITLNTGTDITGRLYSQSAITLTKSTIMQPNRCTASTTVMASGVVVTTTASASIIYSTKTVSGADGSTSVVTLPATTVFATSIKTAPPITTTINGGTSVITLAPSTVTLVASGKVTTVTGPAGSTSILTLPPSTVTSVQPASTSTVSIGGQTITINQAATPTTKTIFATETLVTTLENTRYITTVLSGTTSVLTSVVTTTLSVPTTISGAAGSVVYITKTLPPSTSTVVTTLQGGGVSTSTVFQDRTEFVTRVSTLRETTTVVSGTATVTSVLEIPTTLVETRTTTLPASTVLITQAPQVSTIYITESGATQILTSTLTGGVVTTEILVPTTILQLQTTVLGGQTITQTLAPGVQTIIQENTIFVTQSGGGGSGGSATTLSQAQATQATSISLGFVSASGGVESGMLSQAVASARASQAAVMSAAASASANGGGVGQGNGGGQASAQAQGGGGGNGGGGASATGGSGGGQVTVTVHDTVTSTAYRTQTIVIYNNMTLSAGNATATSYKSTAACTAAIQTSVLATCLASAASAAQSLCTKESGLISAAPYTATASSTAVVVKNAATSSGYSDRVVGVAASLLFGIGGMMTVLL